MDALKNSGFREEFTYQKENIPNDINRENKKFSKKKKKKNRKRKIRLFNPTFWRLASINIGKEFLKLIDKHFKHNNILHKIFNRKTLKIRDSCKKDIFQIINNHNKEIIKEFHDQTNNNNNNNNSKQNECNCKTRMNCPMNGLCNLDNVIYEGIIYQKKMFRIEKLIYEFPRRNRKLNTLIINFHPPMNIWKTKQSYLSIFGVWKIRVWSLRFNGSYWKNRVLQNALKADVMCA